MCGHPERKIVAKGMCKSCYYKDYRLRRNPNIAQRHSTAGTPTCGHPDRKIRAKGMCKACYKRAEYVKDGKDIRVRIRCRRHGLSSKQLEEMYAAQHGLCASCAYPFSYLNAPGPRMWHSTPHIDHDHETGVVRGLLCAKCNAGIGFFFDDPIRLEMASEYLRRHGK